jgi:NUDIX domain
MPRLWRSRTACWAGTATAPSPAGTARRSLWPRVATPGGSYQDPDIRTSPGARGCARGCHGRQALSPLSCCRPGALSRPAAAAGQLDAPLSSACTRAVQQRPALRLPTSAVAIPGMAGCGTAGTPTRGALRNRKLISPPEQPARPSLYPRIDPAVIMAVTAGDHILLGHQSRWVDGRYSLLAGAGAAVDAGQCCRHCTGRYAMAKLHGILCAAVGAVDQSLPVFHHCMASGCPVCHHNTAHSQQWCDSKCHSAGFCEIGETLEQAVVRETREEAGAPSTQLLHA